MATLPTPADVPDASERPEVGERPDTDGLAALHEAFARHRDPRRRDELVARYAWLARSLARRFAGRGESTEDLEQVAYLGLIHAVDRFDPARGHPFRAFAEPTIVGELKRHFRDHRWGLRVGRAVQERYLATRAARDDLYQELRRTPSVRDIADRLGLDPDQVVEAMDAGAAFAPLSLQVVADATDGNLACSALDPSFEAIEIRDFVESLLARLPERQAGVLRLHSTGMTQRQIGRTIGASQMCVCRQLARGCQTLHNLARAT
ncbi:MAG: sigma-70 family RNA polymerase sigma factor [Acidimicrobiia bacterium]